MDQLSDEEVDIRDEEEEEDSDKEDQDLDKMFGAWLGELDKLTQVLRMSWAVLCCQNVICLSYVWLFDIMPIKQIALHTFILLSSCLSRAWMMDAQDNLKPNRKPHSDRRPTWLTSLTDSPSIILMVRHMFNSYLLWGTLQYSILVFFSCFYFWGFAEALNQGENVDLDALMADLSSIEQELSTINSKPNSSMTRLGLTDTKVHKKHVHRITDSLSVPDI